MQHRTVFERSHPDERLARRVRKERVMRHRRIDELLTREVVSVRSDTPFREIVRMLSQHRVTAGPVVDEENRVIGVVSEGDLLRKTADRGVLSAIERMCATVDGVVSVSVTRLTYEKDDVLSGGGRS
ncbi:CBS domain-containing protein [Streptomyces sp. NRRL B-24572]|uniref:CBS domain-containing protein n=1 Tax=Streptomyces sp. NRRL B-24572 TaxID=1962156 RepID=UPI00211AF9DF|nr:CBS domain-containing protein [Streptomyces sp. NRRL B-24572]